MYKPCTVRNILAKILYSAKIHAFVTSVINMDSSVGIGTRLLAGHRGIVVRFPAGGRDSILPHNVLTSSGDRTTYAKVIGGFFLGAKAEGRS